MIIQGTRIKNTRLVTGVFTKPGLVLHLNAGDTNSYPGSGTTWTDTVNNIEFTLYNSPTYSSNNGGYIEFNPASGQYAQSPALPSALSDWTVEAWLYHDTTHMSNNQSPCIITDIYAGNPINFTLGNTSDSFPNLQAGAFSGSWASTPIGITLTTGNWYQVLGSWDSTSHMMRLYINGVEVSSYNWPGFTVSTGAQGLVLMRRWDNPQFWGGRLGVVRIYNRALSNGEIINNWNYDRGRLGL